MKRKNLSVIRTKTPKTYLSLPDKHYVEALLEKFATEDYRREWADILMQHQENLKVKGVLSVVTFRLDKDWLALPTIFFKEVIQDRLIHQIPHKSGNILRGIVNVGGELQLCISLNDLLGINSTLKTHSKHPYQYERMIAIVKDGELWVFPVDEVEGIDLWDISQLENLPITISKSTANYLKGIMNKDNRTIGLLDEELLFYSLKRSIV